MRDNGAQSKDLTQSVSESIYSLIRTAPSDDADQPVRTLQSDFRWVLISGIFFILQL